MAVKTASKFAADVSDESIVDFLRLRSASITELVKHMGVTATAVRQRLTRLMERGFICRESQKIGRGRPNHRYSLTPAGIRSGGNNYELLALALWNEVRQVQDPAIRQGLLQRISTHMAEGLQGRIAGETAEERIGSLATELSERNIPFVAERREGGLPVLTALACPYPDLAEQDRGICAVEKMVFSQVVGQGLRLSSCRLDGESCCTFEASAPSSNAAGVIG